MYLFIKNTKNFTNKKIGLIVKKINLLLFLSILIFSTVVKGEDVKKQNKYIGFVESVSGKASTKIDDTLNKLSEFDQIFVDHIDIGFYFIF